MLEASSAVDEVEASEEMMTSSLAAVWGEKESAELQLLLQAAVVMIGLVLLVCRGMLAVLVTLVYLIGVLGQCHDNNNPVVINNLQLGNLKQKNSKIVKKKVYHKKSTFTRKEKHDKELIE